MSFDIIAIDFFDKQAKRLVKKYPSLQNELKQLQKQLSELPKPECQLDIIVTKSACV